MSADVISLTEGSDIEDMGMPAKTGEKKKKKNENWFLQGKSFLLSTYPVIVAIRTERNVPIAVTLIVIP